MTAFYLNGEVRELPDGSTVADVVDLFAATAACAVARNGEIVIKSTWGAVELGADDRIEVLSIAPGG